MEHPDLYELLNQKLRGYQIRGHPFVVASFLDITLTCTKKITTFPEDIKEFKENTDAYPKLKHALEQHKDMTKYKIDYFVYSHALGFLPCIEAGICKHKYHFNCFWEYASTSRRCPICRVPYPREMYDFFCTIFVPEGSEVINHDIGELDIKEAGHPDELQAGINKVDIASRDEDKMIFAIEKQLISGLNRPDFDVDEFLGRVPHATPGDEVTPKRQGGSDYLEEVDACTLARLRRDVSIMKGWIKGNRPLTWAQAKVLFPHFEEPKHSQPQEVTLAEIPMDVVEDIQTPSPARASEPIETSRDDVPTSKSSQSPPMEPMVHEDHQSPMDIQDESSVPNYIVEDQHVEESSPQHVGQCAILVCMG
ncbi:hypothetical protein R1flu_022805 [Riccia fluitans]|uniref:RING-type domain-containing protein n=1 Tax=Riccia fluitans TaxID=41844 RepID=A0ABD1XUB6_9MARC